MKRTEPKSFAQIFDEGMRRAGLTDTVARQQACYLWPEIVGPGVNRYTLSRYVDDDGRLYVQITSAPLRQELAYMKSSIIANINRAVGSEAITDIEFH